MLEAPGRPDWLYEPKKGDRESEYLPLIHDLEVPQGIEDEISSVWGDMVAAKGIRYYDRSGVEKRAREEMGNF